MTIDEALQKFTKFVQEGRATFIRRQSVRFKVYSYTVHNQDKTFFFLYDRKKGIVSKIIKQEEALFKIGETIQVLVQGRILSAKIVRILPAGELPSQYQSELQIYSNCDRLCIRKNLHTVPTVLAHNDGKIYQYTLSLVRKLGEYDENSIRMETNARRKTYIKKLRK